MESRTEPQIRSKVSEKLIPKFALKLGIAVRNDHFREPVELENMVNEQASILLCSYVFPAGDKMDHFGWSVNKYGDGSHPL